jgi:hypothetical protein
MKCEKHGAEFLPPNLNGNSYCPECIKDACRKKGFVVLEDHPRNEGEDDCDYWKRILSLMPQEQKDSVQGAIAQIGTYRVVVPPILMSEDLWKDNVEYLKGISMGCHVESGRCEVCGRGWDDKELSDCCRRSGR